MSDQPYDDEEQPEYQWVEDFMEGMGASAIVLVTMFSDAICTIWKNLFSREVKDPPSETE